MSKEKYVKKLLEEFKITGVKPFKTPMEATVDLGDPKEMELPDVPYQWLIGSLMYLHQAPDPTFRMQ